MQEIWKAVPDYEGFYDVSNFGNVRSVDRFVKNRDGYPPRLVKGKPLAIRTDAIQRKVIDLYKSRVRKTAYVHALVLAAFVGPRPENADCCHNDGNPSNNHVFNLRYDTRSGNLKDKVIHGTHNRGEQSPVAKLSNQQVVILRELAKNGTSQHDLFEIFKISKSHIRDIIAMKYRKYG